MWELDRYKKKHQLPVTKCAINLECKLAWHRPLYEDCQWHLLVGRVLHVAMDEVAMAVDLDQRVQTLGLTYNVRGTANPLNGDYYGPNTLGLVERVMRIHTPEQRRIECDGRNYSVASENLAQKMGFTT